MSLHIEINGDCSPNEWRAIAAVAAIMLGETALSSGVVTAPDDGPIVSEVVAVAAPPAPPLPPSEALIAVAASTVAPPAPPAGVELDATGLPWDGRIHAATKEKNKDLTWRARRGLSDDDGKVLVAQVTAELRAIMAAPVPPASETPAHTDAATAFGATAAAPAAPAPQAVAPAPPVPEPVAIEGVDEFARLMRVVVAKQADPASGVTTQLVTEIAQQLGLTSMRDLAKRPDLVPAFEALLP